MIGTSERVQSGSPASRLPGIMLVAALMVAIVGVAAYLRLVGIDWDQNQHLHPDERFLTMVTTNISPVHSLAEYFDTMSSPLNPNNVGFGFFVYGDFPVIAARYIGQLVGEVSYTDVYLVGRTLSAIADLLVLTLIFFIGKQLFDWRIGLLGAALYGAAALPIQLSHFYTVDTFTNLFVTASFLFIARTFQKHRWLDYPLFGVMLGLGIASKVSVAPLALILILALWLRTIRERKSAPATSERDQAETSVSPSRLSPTSRAVIGLIIAGLVTIIAFRVTQPYAFLPPSSGVPYNDSDLSVLMGIASRVGDPIGMRPNPAWLSQMEEVRLQVSGGSDIPPNHQWGRRLPLVFPWVNMVRVGLGWPFGIMCWLGFAWAIWEIARRHVRSDRLLLLVAWVALYFTWQGIGWVMTMRYFLPVYPFLILLAAWAVVTLWDRIQALLRTRNVGPRHPAALFSLGLGAVVVISAYAWGFAVSRIYTRPVTRVAASHWIFDNIPSDVSLFVETQGGERRFELGLPNNYPPTPPNPSQEDQLHPVVSHSRILPDAAQPVEFKSPVTGKLSKIRVNHLLDPLGGTVSRTLSVSVWADIYGNTKLSAGNIAGEFTGTGDPRGGSYEIAIDPVDVKQGQTIYIALQPDSLGPLDVSSSSVATEGEWDDPLPLPFAPYNVWGAQFQGYELQMAWEDIPEKRQRMQSILDNTDYLFISSNRFYASMPRNPNRFPMTVAYYQALFSGRLGFDLIADFTSRPNLGPIQFYDDDAEEAWTVYDHPRVFIFKKTERYSSTNTAAILGSVDLSKTEKLIAKDAKGTPIDIPMPVLKTTASPLQTGSIDVPGPAMALADLYLDFQPITVIIWWLLISITGWLAFPILFSLFPSLHDRAYPLARACGMLLTAWLAWIAASLRLLPWGTASGLVALGITAALSIGLIVRRWQEFSEWLQLNRRHLIFIEVLTLILFGFFLLVRIGNPDLWHPNFGGEKPMDLAYLNAVLKSVYFPPYDPWFAGGTINYYYFGFVIVGLPVKLLGIPTTLAYNLILPTLFALTGTGAFSVAYNIVASRVERPDRSKPDRTDDQAHGLWDVIRAWPRTSLADMRRALQRTLSSAGETSSLEWQPYLAGMAALLMAVVLGNLDQIRTLLFGLAEIGAGTPQWTTTLLPPLKDTLSGLRQVLVDGKALPVGIGEWYWNATRLIPVPINQANQQTEVGPITEFPYFTFLYADLHAHMIAMPITLLGLTWGVAQIRSVGRGQMSEGRKISPAGLFASLLLGALIIGALRPTNTWDWPTYLVLGGTALILAHFYRRGDSDALPTLLTAALGAAVLGGGAYWFFSGTSDPADPNLASVVIGIAGFGAAIGLFLGYSIGLDLVKRRAADDASDHDQLYQWVTLLGALLQAGLLAGLTVVLFLPYALTYKLGYTSFIPWEGSKTPVWAYLDILGLFLFVIVSWMVMESWQWVTASLAQRPLQRAYWLPLVGVIALIVLGIMALLSSSYPIAGLVIPLAVWAAVLFIRRDMAVEKRAVLAMFVFALTLSMVVEVVVLQGDIGRMNTVFKFYLQVWLLMAIAAGAALGWLWPSISRLRDLPRTAWLGVLGVLVFLAALYPLLATRAKVEDRWSTDAPQTLDGMAYMPYVQRFENGRVFPLAPDYGALLWLQYHVSGTPIVLEAHTVEYNWGNRVTVYTGLPAIVGWNWHQRQQRPAQSDEVWARVNDVDTLYNTTDTKLAMTLLQHYGVQLIMVGGLERAYYDPSGIAKFQAMADAGLLRVVYDRGNTQIYQVAKAQP